MVFINKPSAHATPKIWGSAKPNRVHHQHFIENLLPSSARNLIGIHLQKSWLLPICVWSLKKIDGASMIFLWKNLLSNLHGACPECLLVLVSYGKFSVERVQNAYWLRSPVENFLDRACGLNIFLPLPWCCVSMRTLPSTDRIPSFLSVCRYVPFFPCACMGISSFA